jgi:hypothetical protein
VLDLGEEFLLDFVSHDGWTEISTGSQTCP